jgi:hypothetical protein
LAITGAGNSDAPPKFIAVHLTDEHKRSQVLLAGTWILHVSESPLRIRQKLSTVVCVRLISEDILGGSLKCQYYTVAFGVFLLANIDVAINHRHDTVTELNVVSDIIHHSELKNYLFVYDGL